MKKLLQGKQITNFEFDFSGSFFLDTEFIIDLQENCFSFSVDPDILLLNYSVKNFWGWDRIVKKRNTTLFCFDNVGIPFTLYSCTIVPKKFSSVRISEVLIRWDFMIYGAHIENVQEENSDQLWAIVENDTLSYRNAFGSKKFITANGNQVALDWHKNELGEYEGLSVNIRTKEAYSILDLYQYFLRFSEFMCFQAGFFAEPLELKISHNGGLIDYIVPDPGVHKSSPSTINPDLILRVENDDWGTAFDKWCAMYSSDVPVFTSFFNTLYNKDSFTDTVTSELVHVLEGYYCSVHSTKAQKFSPDITKIVISKCQEAIETEEISQMCAAENVQLKDIKKSVAGLLGKLHMKSIMNVIDSIIRFSSNTVAIFQYEHEQKKLKKFEDKIYNHRNFLAHLSIRDTRFIGEENALAQDKIRLLFRVMVLEDIGLEIDRKHLKTAIDYSNMWYKNHKMTY